MTKSQETKKERTKVLTKKVTLSERGPQLPLGILTPDGTYAKDIAVKRWRMAEERELGELRDSNRDANVAQFVSMVLSTMCTKIGPHDFTKLKDQERRIHTSQMFMGDVFYAYVYLRLQTLGNELNLSLTCPSCRHVFPFTADLNSIEVDCCDSLDDVMWEYDLKEPFDIRGKKVETFLMGPPRWNAIEAAQPGGGLNSGAVKLTIILGTIHGIANWKDEKGKIQSIALAPNELDEMGKKDIESITNRLDDNAVGPDMSIQGNCPRCRRDYVLSIDWGYDNFFGISSR